MARTTTNYGFNISEGTDLVNPLTDIFPNFEDIDTDLKAVSDEAVGNATELLTGTVHALTRADSDRDVIRFTATANFTAGETFTVDGAQVTALTPDGQTLATGSYIIGSEVFAILKGTLLTVFVSPAKAKDADLLDGHDSSYFATSSDLTTLDGAVTNISDKVGTGVLDTTAQNCVGAINELNTNLIAKATVKTVTVEASGNTSISGIPSGYILFTTGNNSGVLGVYAGTGYGATNARHHISPIVDATDIEVVPNNNSYAVVVRNNSSVLITVTVIG